MRDRIAAAICNWTLRHIATADYRTMIGGSIDYGLSAAARDKQEGRSLPVHWRRRNGPYPVDAEHPPADFDG